MERPDATPGGWRPGEELGCRTVALPALSTGIYGYPPELAAPVAVGAVRELEDRFDELRFVFLDGAVQRLFASQG